MERAVIGIESDRRTGSKAREMGTIIRRNERAELKRYETSPLQVQKLPKPVTSPALRRTRITNDNQRSRFLKLQ